MTYQSCRSLPRKVTLALSVAAALALTPLQASAGDAPSAEEISTAVSGYTYQGSMSAPASGFAEYYAPDGSIRADGYSGQWRVEDGTMCFKYGEDPESCFGIELQGPSMVLFKEGKIDGNGMLIQGNPNKF